MRLHVLATLAQLGRVTVSVFAAALVAVASTPPARADDAHDCYSEDNERRIKGCSDLIEHGALEPHELSVAYALRGLGYALRSQFELAVPDYDEAIRLKPDFAIALNNRAWAYYKWGKGERGLTDVERALKLSPDSSHAYDTRAHIRHAQGQSRAALADYDLAMRFGGTRMVRLYQCGLQAHGLFEGPLDGLHSARLATALRRCVTDLACDPLPADEECRDTTS